MHRELTRTTVGFVFLIGCGCAHAVPPPCVAPTLERSDLERTLKTEPLFAPVQMAKIEVELDGCALSKSREQAVIHLVFPVVPGRPLIYRAVVVAEFDRQDGKPIKTPQLYNELRRIGGGLPGHVLSARSDKTSALWLADHTSVDGKYELLGAQSCVSYHADTLKGGGVSTLVWCTKLGVVRYSLGRTNAFRTPESDSLLKWVSGLQPTKTLKHVTFSRNPVGITHEWVAAGLLDVSGRGEFFNAHQAPDGSWASPR